MLSLLRPLYAAAAILLATHSPLSALAQEEPPQEQPPNVTIECHMIVVPQKTAMPMLLDLLDDKKTEAMFGKLMAMVESGKAELSAVLAGRGKLGGKLSAEAVQELRYGVNYHGPYLPSNAPEDIAVLKAWPFIGMTPDGFDTREVGASFEVTTLDRPGSEWVGIDGTFLHTRFQGWKKLEYGLRSDGTPVTAEMPDFHDVRSTVYTDLKPGRRTVVGAHKLTTKPEQIEFFFLRLTKHPRE